jgi:haloalkane dehalogenase
MTQSISPAFDFESRYADVHGQRMYYVDTGGHADRPAVVFLHGNPTSSYLWRNIIPHVSGQRRCIAPDLIGMGRSDKPDIAYRYADHMHYLEGFLEQMALEQVVLVVHDWGSGLGLDWARRHADQVAGIAAMEFIRPVASWDDWPENLRQPFRAFRTPGVGEEMIMDNNMFVEQILPGAVSRGLTEAEMQHYRAPYPDAASRKPLWQWPNELPIAGEPADVVERAEAYMDWLDATPIPKLLFSADPGILLSPAGARQLAQRWPACELVELGEGLHFVQEDHPHAIGRAIADWLD